VPRVSVTISVLNGERHLRATIDSILGQTFTDFELIVVNDGSTDGTGEILESCRDPRLIVVHQENRGIAVSRNKATRLARGEFIAVHDADDISMPDRFEKQVRFLDEHPDYALVGSAFYEINEKGKIRRLVRVLTEDADLREFLGRRNWFGHGTVMMRRSAFEEVGRYDERFRYALDYDLFLRMIEKHKVANLKEPLYCWRAAASSVSNKQALEQARYAEMARQEARERSNLPAPSPVAGRCNLLRRLCFKLESEGFPEAGRLARSYGLSRRWVYGTVLFKLLEAETGVLLKRLGLKVLVRWYRKLFYPHAVENP
jgi:glycosyltransferase involved in cell wall biosynthesis